MFHWKGNKMVGGKRGDVVPLTGTNTAVVGGPSSLGGCTVG